MFRLFVFFNLAVLNLLACQGGYDSCIKKIKDSKAIQNSLIRIPVKNHKLLIYSKHKPNAKILKYDPFLSLYLVVDDKNFPYPFDINMRLKSNTAMVNTKRAKSGTILKNQVGLNSLAIYSKKLLIPSILTSSCCNLEGLVTPRGIIQKEYLKRFISSSTSDYADIGIRVKNEGGYVIVTANNPYIKNTPFKKNDCILAFDGIKIKAASTLMRKILFSKIGSKHTLKIKRQSKIIKVKALSYKRYGGGAISDTFLEAKGIYFDKKLHITKLSKYFKSYGLKINDKLIQVNEVKVKTQEGLRKYIEDYKEFSSLLFLRNNFQFFVNIK